MTRCVILSDIHGDQATAWATLEAYWSRKKKIDAYIFLGDGLRDFREMEDGLRAHDPGCTLIAVRGNCDWSSADAPALETYIADGVRVLITHGHHYHVKSELSMLDEAAQERGCDVALYGHTHAPAIDIGQTYMVNPGSAADGRIAVLELEGGKPWAELFRY